jgi:hypothetical protein
MRLIVLAALSVLAVGPALAQAPAAPAQLDPVTAVVRLDTNHDGWVSLQEWAAAGAPAADFVAIDADQDGRVTVAEWRAFRLTQAKTDAERAALKAENPKFDPDITIRMADTNRDGGVTEQEWLAYGGHGGGGFAPIDADHDGKITAQELAAYRDAHKPR